MPEEWIVRVHGKEYGPVDLEELQAWKRDGRLIRENEVREADGERWFPAAELPEVFAEEVAPQKAPARPMELGEILAAGGRIYRKGFWRFFVLAMLISGPSYLLQLAAPFLQMPEKNGDLALVIASTVTAFLMLVAVIIAWPFSVGATQLLAADLFAGRDPQLRDLLHRAKPLWTRLFLMGLVVYGSYILWTVIPFLFACSLVITGETVSMLIGLLLLIFVAYMVARLFINFLFWQPAGALGGNDAMEALRESKQLARSGRERPWWQRPLFQGALIASLWLLLFVLLNTGVELPYTYWKLHAARSLEEMMTVMQEMMKSTSWDLFSALTNLAGSLLNALIRGWLAAVFVMLYFSSKGGA